MFTATDAAKIMKYTMIAEYRCGFFPSDKSATDRITNNRFHTSLLQASAGRRLLPAFKHVTESLADAAGRDTVFFGSDFDLAFQLF